VTDDLVDESREDYIAEGCPNSLNKLLTLYVWWPLGSQRFKVRVATFAELVPKHTICSKSDLANTALHMATDPALHMATDPALRVGCYHTHRDNIRQAETEMQMIARFMFEGSITFHHQLFEKVMHMTQMEL
jgi:hypothetical protein